MREEIKAALNLMNKYAAASDHKTVRAIFERAKEGANLEEREHLSKAFRATLSVFLMDFEKFRADIEPKSAV